MEALLVNNEAHNNANDWEQLVVFERQPSVSIAN
jgi:hypothetical protein